MAAKIGSKETRKRHAALLDRDGDTCWWCFSKFSDDNPYTLDHFTPQVRGGNNSLDNLVLACFWCNQKRSDMNAHDFRVWLHDNFVPVERRTESHFRKEIRKTVKRRRYSESLRLGESTLE